ncbi:hypothetical protein RRG08_016542 [Elysia crispata]|uniref:Uncharacterized protein n=1 Tax=Elysia crispata TaxID=231223 RepID=A0AAE0Y124_9GAST|nr:hypothetical protein RRG08_016542 [Elysia crispata]
MNVHLLVDIYFVQNDIHIARTPQEYMNVNASEDINVWQVEDVTHAPMAQLTANVQKHVVVILKTLQAALVKQESVFAKLAGRGSAVSSLKMIVLITLVGN